MDTPRPVGVSTAWNALKHVSGRVMLQELLDLGFTCFELNVHITLEMISEIETLVRDGRASVCSLHNYCPLPDGMTRESAAINALYLSSPEPPVRRAAVSATKKTIDWAARLGAAAVVLHLGNVPVKQSQGNTVFKLASQGRVDEARDIMRNELMERAMERPPYIESLIASLKELAPYAEDAGIRLGCENRYFYTEIPTLDEFLMIFKQVNSRALGYWHDTGHAHTAETLGIAAQEDYLKKYSDRLIGMHIHDAVAHQDHKPLGAGQIDFSRIAQYIRPDTQLVLEVHNSTPEELINSRKILEQVREEAHV